MPVLAARQRLAYHPARRKSRAAKNFTKNQCAHLVFCNFFTFRFAPPLTVSVPGVVGNQRRKRRSASASYSSIYTLQGEPHREGATNRKRAAGRTPHLDFTTGKRQTEIDEVYKDAFQKGIESTPSKRSVNHEKHC